jgi:putative inorganic carbon (hco3(-)) transporter
MTPFYNDHTSYGAILAMYIPILIGFTFSSSYPKNFKTIIWIVISVLLFATILSYTRAAWISLIGAFGVFVVVKLKIKFRTVLILTASLLILFFTFQKQIFMSMEENTQDSATDLSKHVKSISNISTDASNLERINRWKCAIRMFEKKPILGWGPGTYQFKYAPFQFSYEKTIISTNYGDMGNAHSEYIGPLAESGIFGSLSFLAIVIVTIYTGLMVRRRAKSKEVRLMSLIFTLGLITYYLHGFLNNFLDTDKASVPFWGFTAILVALDVYHSNKEDDKEEETTKAI